MALILAVRHVAFEDLDLFETALRARGHDLTYVDAWDADWAEIAAADPALLAVLGGPIGVYERDAYPWLMAEIAAVGARLRAGRPILGICLGAQIMAASLDARVYPAGVKEIGFAPLMLTAAGRASSLAAYADAPMAFHWHGDTFDLPEGATLLASTAAVAHQAFSVGAHGLGVQFHPECDPARIEAWLVGHAVELAQAGVCIPDLRASAQQHAEALRATAITCAHALITQFGL
jgi:GMP synthase (glutamine-hydrolysing)